MEYKKLQNNSENTFYPLDTDNDGRLYLNELEQTKLGKVFLKELKDKEIKKLNNTLYIQLESLKNKAKSFPRTIEAIENKKDKINRKSKEKIDLINENPLSGNELKSAISYNTTRVDIKPFNGETYKDVEKRYVKSLFKGLNNFQVYVGENKTLEELSIAVAIFQKQNGLTVDGKPGDKTRKILFHSAKDISSSVNFRKNLITDYETRLIQIALKKINTNILIDGDYGQDTLKKVRAVQKRNGIKGEKNGIPGTETLEILNLLGTGETKEDFYTHLIKYDKDKIDSY